MRHNPTKILILVAVWCGVWCGGCAPIDSPGKKLAPKPPIVVESPITTTARQAFQARDVDYAAQLNALADDVDAGQVKFDAKLKQRLDEAKSHAAEASTATLSKVMAAEFGPNALANPGKVSKALRDLAAALK